MSLPVAKVVRFGEKTFNFAFCETAFELTMGLSGVSSLDPYDLHGMLFDFGQNFSAIMAPRGLMFPIDIAFLDYRGEVVQIAAMYPTYGHNVAATQPIRYALEVPLGFFEANGITVGSIFEL